MWSGLYPARLAVTEDDGASWSELKRVGAWGGIVSGTPDEVAAALARERKIGVELFILQFHDFATPETLSLFAREVMSAL